MRSDGTSREHFILPETGTRALVCSLGAEGAGSPSGDAVATPASTTADTTCNVQGTHHLAEGGEVTGTKSESPAPCSQP